MMQMGGEAAAADAELNSVGRSIVAVVTKWPGYARAHLVLAMFYFGIDEAERARAELEIVNRPVAILEEAAARVTLLDVEHGATGSLLIELSIEHAGEILEELGVRPHLVNVLMCTH